MNAMAIVAPILPGKLDEWRAFSRDLHEGSRHSDFTAFMKTCGVSRIRCWGQQGPEGELWQSSFTRERRLRSSCSR